MKSHRMPNGLVVNSANAYETEHLYRDIFEHQVYIQHGITLLDGSLVIDAGANIGLFTLFVLDRCSTALIHAFEPAPKTFELFQANTGSYANVSANNYGLGSHEKQELFTYLPHCTTSSGYYDDVALSMQKERILSSTLADPKSSDLYRVPAGQELLRYRLDTLFQGEVVWTPVRPLSSYIDENHLEQIDLLKIDVEGQEVAVLDGIRDEHWRLIRQAVIEVHTRVADDLLPKVLDVLGRYEYLTDTLPENQFLTTVVYAKRR